MVQWNLEVWGIQSWSKPQKLPLQWLPAALWSLVFWLCLHVRANVKWVIAVEVLVHCCPLKYEDITTCIDPHQMGYFKDHRLKYIVRSFFICGLLREDFPSNSPAAKYYLRLHFQACAKKNNRSHCGTQGRDKSVQVNMLLTYVHVTWKKNKIKKRNKYATPPPQPPQNYCRKSNTNISLEDTFVRYLKQTLFIVPGWFMIERHQILIGVINPNESIISYIRLTCDAQSLETWRISNCQKQMCERVAEIVVFYCKRNFS